MKSKILILIGVSIVLTACGQGTEPFSTLGDPTQGNGPGLSFPVSLNQAYPLTPYSSSTNGFQLPGQLVSTQVTSPGPGIIVAVNTATPSVTIQHNVHVASMISNISLGTVQVGSYVSTGTAIGTVSVAGYLTFSVLVDGAYVCPLSYLTAAARKQIVSTYTGTIINPCSN